MSKPLNSKLDDVTDMKGAAKIMGVTLQRIKQLSASQRLVPVKTFGRKHIYLKSDVRQLRDTIIPRRPRSGQGEKLL